VFELVEGRVSGLDNDGGKGKPASRCNWKASVPSESVAARLSEAFALDRGEHRPVWAVAVTVGAAAAKGDRSQPPRCRRSGSGRGRPLGLAAGRQRTATPHRTEGERNRPRNPGTKAADAAARAGGAVPLPHRRWYSHLPSCRGAAVSDGCDRGPRSTARRYADLGAACVLPLRCPAERRPHAVQRCGERRLWSRRGNSGVRVKRCPCARYGGSYAGSGQRASLECAASGPECELAH